MSNVNVSVCVCVEGSFIRAVANMKKVESIVYKVLSLFDVQNGLKKIKILCISLTLNDNVKS